MPISAANRSTARSIVCVASGRPAPRNDVIGVVFVTTEHPSTSIRGMAYTALDISAVRCGRNAAEHGVCAAVRRGCPSL